MWQSAVSIFRYWFAGGGSSDWSIGSFIGTDSYVFAFNDEASEVRFH